MTENSVWNLDVNGKQAFNALGEPEAELVRVKKSQENLKRGTKEWTDNKAEIKELEAEIRKTREEMGTAGMTVKQLEGYYRQLNKEIKDLTPGKDTKHLVLSLSSCTVTGQRFTRVGRKRRMFCWLDQLHKHSITFYHVLLTISTYMAFAMIAA